MKQWFKIKPEHEKYIRLVAGIIILLLGGVFMLVPFIPLGYIFLFVGLFLLSYYVPFLKNIIDKIKKKDKKGIVEKTERKIEKTEDELLAEDSSNKNKRN